MKEKTLSVSAIKEGTVIDHIKAGQSLKIIAMLHLLSHQHPITLGIYLKSRSLHFKDIIKIENLFLNESQAAQIAIFSPSATVNVINNYKVVQKFQVTLPHLIENILVCPNQRCITRQELIPSSFTIQDDLGRILLRCRFCEKSFLRDELQEKFSCK
jgi:aspartate carbamoyltransferase regulatory subunit